MMQICWCKLILSLKNCIKRGCHCTATFVLQQIKFDGLGPFAITDVNINYGIDFDSYLHNFSPITCKICTKRCSVYVDFSR